MRTFAWTSLIRIIVILAARVYMTNFQSDALYNFFNMNNPATNAVTSCMTEFSSIRSGNNAQFDMLNEKLDKILSGATTAPISTPPSVTPSTGSSFLT